MKYWNYDYIFASKIYVRTNFISEYLNRKNTYEYFMFKCVRVCLSSSLWFFSHILAFCEATNGNFNSYDSANWWRVADIYGYTIFKWVALNDNYKHSSPKWYLPSDMSRVRSMIFPNWWQSYLFPTSRGWRGVSPELHRQVCPIIGAKNIDSFSYLVDTKPLAEAILVYFNWSFENKS